MNTFTILEDPQQKDKDRLFELIFNTDKKLDKSNNKAEIAELKRVNMSNCKYYFVEYEHC